MSPEALPDRSSFPIERTPGLQAEIDSVTGRINARLDVRGPGQREPVEVVPAPVDGQQECPACTRDHRCLTESCPRPGDGHAQADRSERAMLRLRTVAYPLLEDASDTLIRACVESVLFGDLSAPVAGQVDERRWAIAGTSAYLCEGGAKLPSYPTEVVPASERDQLANEVGMRDHVIQEQVEEIGLAYAARDRLAGEVERLRADRDEAIDLLSWTQCPAYKSEGTCISGCHQEPTCQTGAPLEGWDAAALAVLARSLETDEIDLTTKETGQ